MRAATPKVQIIPLTINLRGVSEIPSRLAMANWPRIVPSRFPSLPAMRLDPSVDLVLVDKGPGAEQGAVEFAAQCYRSDGKLRTPRTRRLDETCRR